MAAAHRKTESVIVGLRAPRKKMPGRPAVWKRSLGLRSRVLSLIAIVPVRSSLTKKIAPPPSLAWLSTNRAAADRERHLIPVVVDRAAAAAARSAGLGGVGADADGAVGEEAAVQHRPGDADAAQRAAVAAHVGGEAAVDDVYGKVVVLRQRPDGSASDVRSITLAAVAGEHGVDDAQSPAAGEDGAAAATVELLAARVPVREGQVLDDQLGRGLVLAVRRRPHLRRIAGVHVEDAAPALTAQRHQPASIEDDLRLVFMTLAVALILIVTGLRPHENRMIPPARTAATTAAEVQLAAVPRPTTWLGGRVYRAAGGGHGHRAHTRR
jgi:hypothetical protein